MKGSSHGGDIYLFAKKLKKKPKDIVDFSSNINPIMPKIKTKISKKSLSAYPNFRYIKLKKEISLKYKIKPKNIFLSNGATEAIYLLSNILKKDKITLYAPLYFEYKKAFKAKKVKLINRFSKENKPLKNSLIIFTNPSTPDGKYYKLKKYLKLWKKLKCTVLIDESFLDFANKKSAISYIKRYKKLFIIKSFTKFYAAAGVRVGAIFSHAKNIKKIQKNSPIWNISKFDEEYIKRALKDKKHRKRTLKSIKKNKKRLKKILKKSNLFSKIYPSKANFVLAKSKRKKIKVLQKRLKKEKILVRYCDNFDFLNKRYARFAVKSKKDLKKLKKAIFA